MPLPEITQAAFDYKVITSFRSDIIATSKRINIRYAYYLKGIEIKSKVPPIRVKYIPPPLLLSKTELRDLFHQFDSYKSPERAQRFCEG